MPDNTVTIVGNITRPAELRFSASGAAMAGFGLAVNRVWTDKASNERKEQVSFFNVQTFGQLAENVAESLGKGARVVVTGRIEQRSYETQDGEKRSVVEIVADEVAPSLRFATAQVVRNERADRSASAAPRNSAPARGGDDEEPFTIVGIDETVPAPVRRRVLGGAQ